MCRAAGQRPTGWVPEMARPAGRGGRWTTPADVVDALRRRWDGGTFLTMLAGEQAWEPYPVPLRGPTAGELASDFGAAQAWVHDWDSTDQRVLRLEHRTVGGRAIGTNRLPCRVWIDSYRQLWTLIGVDREVRLFTDLLARTRSNAPGIAAWMAANPMRVLASAADWPRIVRTVIWIDENARPEMYLRQVDVPGVDTKFIESHRKIFADLLDHQLADDRIDRSRPRSDLAGRYGFRSKPDYVRVRRLGPAGDIFASYSELSLRVEEFAVTATEASTVYVVENETTYLAFPPRDDAVVIFGGGYALSRLRPLRWLPDRDLVYWGDIDTHGFSILDRLRQAFPHTRSMLMDRATLLAHDSQWVREPAPVNAPLRNLHADEADLYRDLVEDALGPSLRLEQERVRFSAILDALGARAAVPMPTSELGMHG